MKKILFIVLISILFFAILGGGCGFVGYQTAKGILSNTLGNNLSVFKWCFNGLPFVNQLETLLDDKHYIVLLQNNYELRPTGGFMGSYAVLSTQPSGLGEIRFQDIYVPDGQLIGHVDPPLPIQQAFGQGWWKLRDANWDPDFTVAAPQIAWFFEQGGEKADGIVAINFSFVNSLIRTLGLFRGQDLYNLTQSAAEVNSFAGSTQKSDFLNVVGDTLLQRLENLKISEILPVAKLLWQNLRSGEIMLWFSDPGLEKTVAQRHWDGALTTSVIDTNLGANKANCCVIREIRNSDSLQITYTNTSPAPNPIKPIFWGGNYINYLRIVLPQGTQVQRVRVAEQNLVLKPLDYQYGKQMDRYQIEKRDKFLIVGFWVVVPFQQTVKVDVQYQQPEGQKLIFKNQPGWIK